MKSWLNRRTWGVLGVSTVLMGGLLAASGTAAQAAEPCRDRDRDGLASRWDRDRAGVRMLRDTRPYQRDRYYYAVPRRDNDGDWDDMPNWRYRQLNRRNGTYYYSTPIRRAHDEDRDGIANWRDRDRDGDGVPNWRDRYPDNPHRW
jgi:hypothetical protein